MMEIASIEQIAERVAIIHAHEFVTIAAPVPRESIPKNCMDLAKCLLRASLEDSSPLAAAAATPVR